MVGRRPVTGETVLFIASVDRKPRENPKTKLPRVYNRTTETCVPRTPMTAGRRLSFVVRPFSFASTGRIIIITSGESRKRETIIIIIVVRATVSERWPGNGLTCRPHGKLSYVDVLFAYTHIHTLGFGENLVGDICKASEEKTPHYYVRKRFVRVLE